MANTPKLTAPSSDEGRRCVEEIIEKINVRPAEGVLGQNGLFIIFTALELTDLFGKSFRLGEGIAISDTYEHIPEEYTSMYIPFQNIENDDDSLYGDVKEKVKLYGICKGENFITEDELFCFCAYENKIIHLGMAVCGEGVGCELFSTCRLHNKTI